MKILYLFYSNVKNNNWIKANFTQVFEMVKALNQREETEIKLGIPFNKIDIYLNAQTNILGETSKISFTYYKSYIPSEKINRYLLFLTAIPLIKKEKPQAIYTRDVVLLFSSWFFPKINYYYESHNYLMHNGSKMINAFLRLLFLWTSNRKNVKKIIPISENLGKFWHKKGIYEEKILPLHDGFSNQLFLKEESIYEARSKINFNQNAKIALYMGSLYKDREIENIIELSVLFTQVQFKIIGGPSENITELKKLCRQKDISNVEIIGTVPHNQIATYLFASDILLALWSPKVPTINYCSPLKLFEYMAAGRIIIAHGFPTIREVLTHNENALIVQPDLFDDLQLKFEIAITNDLEYIGINARKLAFEKYSWEMRARIISETMSN